MPGWLWGEIRAIRLFITLFSFPPTIRPETQAAIRGKLSGYQALIRAVSENSPLQG